MKQGTEHAFGERLGQQKRLCARRMEKSKKEATDPQE